MCQKTFGFTLPELMVAMTAAAISLSLAFPSFAKLAEKRKVSSVANEISSFLAHAQSEAITRYEPITVSVQRNESGANWCIGSINESQKIANEIDHCECDLPSGHPASCSVDGQLRTITQEEFETVFMDGLVGDDEASQNIQFAFGPIIGIKVNEEGTGVDPEQHAFTIRSDNANYRTQLNIAVTGRVQICSPDQESSLPNVYSCAQQSIVPISGVKL